MKQVYVLQGNQEGSVLVYSLVVLLLLAMGAMLGSKTSVYEMNLSGNDREIHEMRNIAESTAAVAAQLFDLLPDDVCRDNDWTSSTRLPWYSRGINDKYDSFDGNRIARNSALESDTQKLENWKSEDHSILNSARFLDENTGEEPAGFPNCRYQVIDTGRPYGESLETGNDYSNMHVLMISGVHERDRHGGRKCIVQIGFRKEF